MDVYNCGCSIIIDELKIENWKIRIQGEKRQIESWKLTRIDKCKMTIGMESWKWKNWNFWTENIWKLIETEHSKLKTENCRMDIEKWKNWKQRLNLKNKRRKWIKTWKFEIWFEIWKSCIETIWPWLPACHGTAMPKLSLVRWPAQLFHISAHWVSWEIVFFISRNAVHKHAASFIKNWLQKPDNPHCLVLK